MTTLLSMVKGIQQIKLIKKSEMNYPGGLHTIIKDLVAGSRENQTQAGARTAKSRGLE